MRCVILSAHTRACPFKSKALDCLLRHYCPISHPTSKLDPTYTRNPSVRRRREKRGIISPAADTPLHPLQRPRAETKKRKRSSEKVRLPPMQVQKSGNASKKAKGGHPGRKMQGTRLGYSTLSKNKPRFIHGTQDRKGGRKMRCKNDTCMNRIMPETRSGSSILRIGVGGERVASYRFITAIPLQSELVG
jgi:hypothetical protein